MTHKRNEKPMIIHQAAEETAATLKTPTTSAIGSTRLKSEHRSFDCPMLRQRTRLTIIYPATEVGESGNPAPDHLPQIDCDSKLRCGIARLDAQGYISYNWVVCPACTGK